MLRAIDSEFRRPFDGLMRDVQEWSEQGPLYFMIADGNRGDSMIREGTEALLRDAGLKWRSFDMSSRAQKIRCLMVGVQSRRNATLLFNGGGAWSPLCSSSKRASERQSRVSGNVVVLPSTFELSPEVAFKHLYRRDNNESRTNAPGSTFCHDLAFYLHFVDEELWYGGLLPEPERNRGYFLRSDNERSSSLSLRVELGRDLSASGSSTSDVKGFVQEIAKYEEVVTDRLHVGVAALLLGRRVKLIEGASFKIRAIFAASIEPYFPNVELVSPLQAQEALFT